MQAHRHQRCKVGGVGRLRRVHVQPGVASGACAERGQAVCSGATCILTLAVQHSTQPSAQVCACMVARAQTHGSIDALYGCLTLHLQQPVGMLCERVGACILQLC